MSQEELLEIMKKGDPKCDLQIGDKFEKTLQEKGDIHLIGDKGEIHGSIYYLNQSLYLVHFDNDADNVMAFIIGIKITKI